MANRVHYVMADADSELELQCEDLGGIVAILRKE